jgi:hypothetical protein
MAAMAERDLEIGWVERLIARPEWIEPDTADVTVERRFGAVPERADRIMRVVCRETASEIFVISCFLDRAARRPS